jgi:DNA polymerase I-like protein with 3'-5' exonuclease and polymerase domains
MLPYFDFDIVTASKVATSKDDIKKQTIYKFYIANSSDYKRFIRPNKTVIVPLGFAISAIIKSSDLSTECFYDYVFNKTYFYAPQTNTHCVPIDSIDELFVYDSDLRSYLPKDNSKVEFAKYQIQQVISHYEVLKLPREANRLSINRITTKEGWKEFYNKFKDHIKYPKIYWDTETNSLDWFTGKIGDFTCSFDGIRGYHILWDVIDLNELNELLSGKYQMAQNGKFDTKYTKKYRISAARIDLDTLQLGKHLNEMRFNSLKSLVYHYTAHGGYDFELDQYKDKFGIKNYLDIPYAMRSTYATMDSILGYQVADVMLNQMDSIDKKYPPQVRGALTLKERFFNIRMPSDRMYANIEIRGFHVNMEQWDKSSDEIYNRIVKLKKEILEFLSVANVGYSSSFDDMFNDDEEFMYEESEEEKNLNSGMKLGKLLEALGWENLGRAKLGFFKTGDDELTRWEQLGHTEATLIKQLRSYLTLMKTFLGKKGTQEGWRAYVRYHPEDGSYRIHCSYGSMMTDSGRNSCGSPNYQQIPSSSLGAELFKKIIYVPDPDLYYLVTIDYKAFQIFLSALDNTYDNSRDNLFELLLNNPNTDLHSKTSYTVFCKANKFTVNEVVINQDGKDYIYFDHEEVKVKRNNEIVRIKVLDIQETDELVA